MSRRIAPRSPRSKERQEKNLNSWRSLLLGDLGAKIIIMRAVRLHGPADLRLEELPHPGQPPVGHVLLKIKSVGICGSDLHTYQDARIGNTILQGPLVLGHEFAGIVEAVGRDAIDGTGQSLEVGTRVAIDPAQPCGHCELCEKGDPNLCLNLKFLGLSPNDGGLQDYLIVPARTCFALPADADFAIGALLETLGVALHAVDLAKIRVGDSAAILGAGPIGLCILQIAKLAGASPIFVTDKFDWRLKLAGQFGAISISANDNPVHQVMTATRGRGVNVAIEAAWADQSIQQAAEMARNGGRLVLVGIPGDDRMTLQHSTARRKGLTIRMARRMKHVYPRAIDLYRRRAVDLDRLITHRFPLEKTAEAFAMNAKYEDGVVKAVIDL
jgi:L-iditol 2-dehydrogenase